jgi:sugar phosphate isomerase/epimerase
MKRQFSLAHLTAINCPPPELTYMAARCGYDFVSLRFIPLHTAGEPEYLPTDQVMLRRTKAAMAETGVRMLDVELARILPDVDLTAYLPALEAAAELGARHVISSAWTTDRSDFNYLVDCFGRLCDMARPLGLTVDLEFPIISRLNTLADTAAVVRAAGRPNGGVMVDMLYMYFPGTPVEELDAIPREWFHMAHICDAPKEVPTTREGLVHIMRDARLYVGEGAIDIHAILDRMPTVPYSIELPNAERVASLGCEEHARRCLETARRYLDGHQPAVAA